MVVETFSALSCSYPKNKSYTGYTKGCRCSRCIAGGYKYKKYWQKINDKHLKIKRKRYYKRWTKKLQIWQRNYRQNLKINVLTAYGNGRCQCICCGEKELSFLSLDHIFNDGMKDKKKFGRGLYRYLEKEHFPHKDRYQTLCMNCQFGRKGNKGICPHQS